MYNAIYHRHSFYTWHSDTYNLWIHYMYLYPRLNQSYPLSTDGFLSSSVCIHVNIQYQCPSVGALAIVFFIYARARVDQTDCWEYMTKTNGIEKAY